MRLIKIMTNKQTKKTKRPLQTTLGKAPSQNEKEEIDLSHVKKPIETSIYGLPQVLNLLKTATEEVKDYITYECDIMYECRMCRTIFRSLANFILHKRNYCLANYKSSTSNCREDFLWDKVPPPEPPKEMGTNKVASAKGLTPVIEKLKEKQEIKQLTQELMSADLSSEHKTEGVVVSESDMLLEEIATNNAAVFQTVLQSLPQSDVSKAECMKKEVMELHGIMESDKAVLGNDGKICDFQTNKLNNKSVLHNKELICTECNIKFSTRKTLSFHLKNKHNNSRLVYVCPDCKETYCNAWSVYRHLFKVHRKSAAQVKRLREQVYNSVIRKDQETHKKIEKKDSSKLDKADEENQWLNNIEGDKDFQMCGGCGKRFERKAALQSHASMCVKRIAVCNTIKENNAKKKEEESKDTKLKANKSEKTASPEIPEAKGASKRKPYLLRTYKQSTENKVDGKMKNAPEAICDTLVNGSNSDNEKSLTGNCDINRKVCVSRNDEVKDNCTKGKETVVDDDAKEKDCVCTSLDTDKMLNILGIDPDDRIELIEEVTPPPQQLDAKCEQSQEIDAFCNKVEKDLQKVNKTDGTNELNDKPRISPSNETDGIKISESCSKQNESSPQRRITIGCLEESQVSTKDAQPVNEDNQIPETGLSPKASKRTTRNSRVVKRKITSSPDSEKTAKTFKQSNFDILLDKQDLNFMAKASPYMDRAALICKACRTKHPSLSKLLWHMSAHFSWFRFQCSRCSFVSFGKSECASHAKITHEIKNSEMSSVVLPIPNWKTLLMSNGFKELSNENELGGKHTDEVKTFCQSEPVSTINDEDDSMTSIINTLFVDSESDTTDLNELANVKSFPMPLKDGMICSVKDEIIDVAEDDEENFQLEVPQEIYSLDVFEVINVDGEDDRRPCVKDCDEECEAPNCSAIGNVRPTRNRMRSIKTLQNDFFYDLDIGRQIDTVAKANGPHKQKKNNGSSSLIKKDAGVYSKK